MDVASGRCFAAQQVSGSLGWGPGLAEEVDLGISGMVTGREVFAYVVRRPFVVWLISGVMLLPVFGFLFLAGAASVAEDDGGEGILAMSWLIWFVPPALGFASLLVPVRIGKREFGVLIDDEQGAAESAYGHVYLALGRRQTPADSVTPRRFSPGIGHPARNYLRVTKGKVEIWVTISPSGTDLWVGWTAWVRHWPIVMPFTLAGQAVNSAQLKGGAFHEALRLSEVRAVIDGTHHAVLEGVDTALAGHASDVRSAFGYDLPVEVISAEGTRSVAAPTVPLAPVPAPAPAPVPTPAPDSSFAPSPPAPDPYGPPPDPTTRQR